MAKSGFGPSAESLSLLALRIPLGLIFIAHGAQKLFGLWGGHGVSATIKSFEEHMGIPPLFSILAMFAEFGGGVGVLAGCLTRLSAFGIACVMGVAIYKVHWAHGLFLNLTGRGNGFEFALALLGMALALVLGGGGQWAVDRLIWKR